MQKYIWHVQFSSKPEPKSLDDLRDLEVEATTIMDALEGARDALGGAQPERYILEIRRGKRA